MRPQSRHSARVPQVTTGTSLEQFCSLSSLAVTCSSALQAEVNDDELSAEEAEKAAPAERSAEHDFLAAGVMQPVLQMATRLRRSLTEGVSMAVHVRGVPACVGKGDTIALQLLDECVRCVLKRVAASPCGPSRMWCCKHKNTRVVRV